MQSPPKGNRMVYNIPVEKDMPQLHIKIDNTLHTQLKQHANTLNYSIQEIAERALLQISQSPELLSINPPMAKAANDFSFIDLFAGIGGMRLAFQNQGGRCVFSSEWDKYSQKTYFENFGDMPHGDITKIDPVEIPSHDVLLAGFPCQPFSIAGVSKKKSLGRAHGFKDKTQGTLFFNVAQIINTKRPKMFLLENVKNLKSHDKGNTFKIIQETLDDLGYEVFSQVIDARNYVPQHRERIFLVGYDRNVFDNNINFKFPIAPDHNPVMSSILNATVDKKYTLSDKLWNYLQQYAAKHKAKGNGFGFGICGKNDVARTLSARYYKDGSEILIKNGRKNPRRLTPRECARLMGYPEEFKIPVSDTQAYKQFGNSVVTPVIGAIAKNMIKTFQKSNLQKKSGAA